jgi:hypothetical protein
MKNVSTTTITRRNSLATKGLSLSQAQSISNLCSQRAAEIANILSGINNYSKTVRVDKEDFVTVTGKKMPVNVISLLKEKASLHACQAFLMENIKAKDNMLEQIRYAKADVSSVVFPERPKDKKAELLPEVDDNYGWEQLSVAEVNAYIEAEAFASHIGQFIHKDSPLDRLRRELPTIPAIEWTVIKGDGSKSPVKIDVHHTSEGLLKTHEELAALHREYEQKVNYTLAKIKNIVTARNADIAKVNADEVNMVNKINEEIRMVYDSAYQKANEEVQSIRAEFEKDRQASIKEIAAMRIGECDRFQEVIDIFLPKVKEV